MNNFNLTEMKLNKIEEALDHKSFLPLINNDEIVRLEMTNGETLKGKIKIRNRNFIVFTDAICEDEFRLVMINQIVAVSFTEKVSTKDILQRITKMNEIFDFGELKKKLMRFFRAEEEGINF